MLTKLKKKYFSYSFSFSKTTCDDVRYFKKTYHLHNLNNKVEKFVLDFIKSEHKGELESLVKRGRPKKGKEPKTNYEPISFSFKEKTIKTIQEYKKLPDMPVLDHIVEQYLNFEIPVRVE